MATGDKVKAWGDFSTCLGVLAFGVDDRGATLCHTERVKLVAARSEPITASSCLSAPEGLVSQHS